MRAIGHMLGLAKHALAYAKHCCGLEPEQSSALENVHPCEESIDKCRNGCQRINNGSKPTRRCTQWCHRLRQLLEPRRAHSQYLIQGLAIECIQSGSLSSCGRSLIACFQLPKFACAHSQLRSAKIGLRALHAEVLSSTFSTWLTPRSTCVFPGM